MKHSNTLESWLSLIILVVTIILMTIEIVMRYVFTNSLVWSEEISRYLFIWFVYISMSYAVTENAHIKVDVLFKMVPERAKLIVKQVGLIVWMLFSLVFAYLSTQYSISLFDTGAVAGASRVPMWIISIGIPLGFILTTYRLLLIFVKNLKKTNVQT